MEKGEQASELQKEKPQRPPKEWPMRLSVPGDSRTLLWYGFKCGSKQVLLAATPSNEVWRTCVEARAQWEGDGTHLPHLGQAVLRPGDTFNRVLGKRLALSRLVKLLIPGKGAAEKKKRGKLFLALAPTPRAPRLSSPLSIDTECKPVNGNKSGMFNYAPGDPTITTWLLSRQYFDKMRDRELREFERRMNGLKLPTERGMRVALEKAKQSAGLRKEGRK